MAKEKRITVGGNFPLPGQTSPRTIILTQPVRFGADNSTVVAAIRNAENVDFTRRVKLYDLHDDIMIDTHLFSVIDKRIKAIECAEIEFYRDGKIDEQIHDQIEAPWFNELKKDIIKTPFHGCSLFQFYREKGWIKYDLIPRKHVDPIREVICRYQGDINGTPWSEFSNLLFVGNKKDLGMLTMACPWVLYKRGNMGDWAQFNEVFGMPIREYLYDASDDEARARLMIDAQNEGGAGIFIHTKESELNLKESGNKSGSADTYEKLLNTCNHEISKAFVSNTLSSEASDKGTQALGTVQKEDQDVILKADRKYLLNVLNYEMTDIFANMGINTAGGRFQFVEKKDIDLTAKMNIVSQLKKGFNLPIDDDYLYNTFGIEKPTNYTQMKAEADRQSEEFDTQIKQEDDNLDDTGDKKGETKAVEKKKFINMLRGFFVHALEKGALKF